MSQSQSTTPSNHRSNTDTQLPSDLMAGQEQQSTPEAKPARPHPQTAAPGFSTGRYASSRLGPSSSSRPQPDRNTTAPSSLFRMDTTQTKGTANSKHRFEKKQQQLVDIEDDYFALNLWYNERKEKPVFGLGQPLPHTTRRGMWWGRGDLKQPQEEDERDIKEHDWLDNERDKDFREDSSGSQFPLQDDTDYDHWRKPDHPESREGSRIASIRRPTTDAANSIMNNRTKNHEGQERAPVNEHGLANSEPEHNGPQRNHFGLQDGLHPLQELDSIQTTQTQKEEKEIEQRWHEAQQDCYDQYRNPIARLRAQYPQAPAEFLATFVYLFLGIASNLSIATSSETTGNFETEAWAWGFAVTVGIYLSGGISGGHLSPTITIALSVFRGFPWRMAIVYICMQMLAGLAAGGLAYALYSDAINSMDPGLTLDITGKALFPKGPAFSTTTGFFNDFVFMAIYVCIAFALGDDQNSPPGQGMTALIFGFMGYLMMVALGYQTGLGISPARDLGPRLVAKWVGYESAFSDAYWAWGPWGASVSGALFGGFIYDLFIFVGGESPVNYRWPQPGDIKWKVKEKKEKAKDQIQRIA